MNQESLVELQKWALSFLKFFNAKLVENFSLVGWAVALIALLVAYDYSKLSNGKGYRIVGLLHDILKLTFVSITLAISVVAVYIVAPMPGSLAEIKLAIENIKIPEPIDPDPELKAENDRLKRELGALYERNSRLEGELQQAQQRDLDMLTQLLVAAYQSGSTSDDNLTRIVSRSLGDWSLSYETMRFVLQTGNGLISVTCSAPRGTCKFGSD
jgi:hypothetical protein